MLEYLYGWLFLWHLHMRRLNTRPGVDKVRPKIWYCNDAMDSISRGDHRKTICTLVGVGW